MDFGQQLRRPLQVGTGAQRGVARARRRVPGGRRGSRRPFWSSRHPFWAKASAGLRRRRPGGRQAAWTWRGACRLPCRRLRHRRRLPGRPPQQVAPLVSPCAPAVAATPPRVPFGERQVGAPLLVAWALFVSCLVMRAGGVAGCGGGSLDQGDGSNQLPAARGGAPACGGGRGCEGLVDGGWTVFQIPSTPGSPKAVGSNTCGSDRAWAAVNDAVLQVSAGARDAALQRCRCRSLSPVEDAGQLAASAFQTRGSSREIDGRPAGFEGCPRAAASSKKETAGARRRQRCWPLTVRSCSALERTLDRMQCDEHPADMRLHNLQRQVAARPHAWIS